MITISPLSPCYFTKGLQPQNNILDGKGRVRPEVREARSKGVVMDVGAASANFGVELPRVAIEQGLLPDTISSDITKPRAARPVVYTLPELMTMFMGLGMSLDQVVAAATSPPARGGQGHPSGGGRRPHRGGRRTGGPVQVGQQLPLQDHQPRGLPRETAVEVASALAGNGRDGTPSTAVSRNVEATSGL